MEKVEINQAAREGQALRISRCKPTAVLEISKIGLYIVAIKHIYYIMAFPYLGETKNIIKEIQGLVPQPARVAPPLFT